MGEVVHIRGEPIEFSEPDARARHGEEIKEAMEAADESVCVVPYIEIYNFYDCNRYQLWVDGHHVGDYWRHYQNDAADIFIPDMYTALNLRMSRLIFFDEWLLHYEMQQCALSNERESES